MKFQVFFGFLLVLSGTSGVSGVFCPHGWSTHDWHCYMFRHETYNWFHAQTVCEMMGGYLAEDSSDSRHWFLKDLVKSQGHPEKYTWIGLQDFAEENEFVWSKSQVRAHPTFWRPSEPQDMAREEDCVAIHRGGWIDINCEDARLPFICEMEATEDPVVG